MSTSANVTEYKIFRNGVQVGDHRQHHYCKDRSQELLRFQPLEDHSIQAHWLDEEEEYNESKPVKLLQFLSCYRWFQKAGRVNVPHK